MHSKNFVTSHTSDPGRCRRKLETVVLEYCCEQRHDMGNPRERLGCETYVGAQKYLDASHMTASAINFTLLLLWQSMPMCICNETVFTEDE